MRPIAVAVAFAGVLIAVPALAVDRLVDGALTPCVAGALPHHPTISAAVSAAAPGETILVCPGTYREHVTVATPDLTLRAQGAVHVSAPSGADSVLRIAATRVTLEGFDVSGSRGIDACAVRVVEGDDADIRGLRVHHSTHAICIAGGGGHRLRDNVLEGNAGIAIAINRAGAEVSHNTTSHSGILGLVVGGCDTRPVIVRDNTFTERTAMSLIACDALVTDNTVRGDDTDVGILATGGGTVIQRNAIGHTRVAVKLIAASGGTVSLNTITASTTGIDLSESTGVTVTGNRVSGSTVVDCAWDATGRNVLANNSCGTQQPPGTFD